MFLPLQSKLKRKTMSVKASNWLFGIIMVVIIVISILTTGCQKPIEINITYVDGNENTDGGNVIGNKKLNNETITDIDGNVYHSIVVGNQEWMIENLKTTKYSDGTAIQNVIDDSMWKGLKSGAYCYYNNDGVKYNKLYNWYAVTNSKNICPAGWHVPTNDEWIILGSYLGGNTLAGGKLKEIGTSHWETPNAGATNETGFTSLPSGFRNYAGGFGGIGTTGNYWSSSDDGGTHTSYWQVYYNEGGLYQFGNPKQEGYSVRCIKTKL
jgi:uncharacterized protein (TIGR02145 family)